jgi:hypothetical protein
MFAKVIIRPASIGCSPIPFVWPADLPSVVSCVGRHSHCRQIADDLIFGRPGRGIICLVEAWRHWRGCAAFEVEAGGRSAWPKRRVRSRGRSSISGFFIGSPALDLLRVRLRREFLAMKATANEICLVPAL